MAIADLASQKRILRMELEAHGTLTFERKDAVRRWHTAIQELADEGFLETELKETGEQSSVLEVRRKR